MDAAERIRFHALTFVEEGDEIVIGRPEIDSFAVFPADAAAVVRHLQNGESIPRVGDWYLETYGERADIEDLVETLRDLEFLRDPADPEPAEGDEPPPATVVRGHRLGRLAFSAPAWVLYTLVVAVAGWIAARTPGLHPTPSAVFFSSSLVVIELTIFAGQLVGVAWHESFHVLAGRRLNLPSRLSIGRRLVFVVFETTLAGLMGVPRARRILPFCAGLVADALYFAALIGVGEADRLAHAGVTDIGRIACALAYMTLLRMLWQVMVFMETDLYHVVTVLLRCPDLHALTRAYLRNTLWRRLGRPERATDESGWTAHDRAMARRYAPFVVLGATLMIAVVLKGIAPVIAGFAVRLAHGISAGALDDPHFWDSAVAATAILSQFGLLTALAVRDRRRRRAAAVPAS
ncbi:hypothetical protein [Kitasatospora mediocidica]|uniref:hypothetical protein n=1 Tax=Kitasatospora mediocidica TaxID=58352 RepID=UPI00056976AF|nr:hypothetical protein [Kitasatospora mediocidica]